MCDIWKRTTADEIGPAEFDRQLEDIEELGVEWVVFSGGEPLLHADLFRKAAELRRRKIRTTLLSSGLLIARHAAAIVQHFDDMIVSLDGPRSVHDRIRGVPRAFDVMASGIEHLHDVRPDFPVSARCTVQRANCAHLMATVAAARGMGLNSVSFLAADIHSVAFNRQPLAIIGAFNIAALTRDDLPALYSQVEELIDSGLCNAYVRESPDKLRRIVRHFRSYLGDESTVAPRCNAPWQSAVLDADGTVRPCFFHPPFGRIDEQTSLSQLVNGTKATAFLAQLNVESDPVCRRCVCSLNYSHRPPAGT